MEVKSLDIQSEVSFWESNHEKRIVKITRQQHPLLFWRSHDY